MSSSLFAHSGSHSPTIIIIFIFILILWNSRCAERARRESNFYKKKDDVFIGLNGEQWCALKNGISIYLSFVCDDAVAAIGVSNTTNCHLPINHFNVTEDYDDIEIGERYWREFSVRAIDLSHTFTDWNFYIFLLLFLFIVRFQFKAFILYVIASK